MKKSLVIGLAGSALFGSSFLASNIAIADTSAVDARTDVRHESSQAPASYVRPVLGLGMGFGGDTLREYEVEYYGGDEDSEKVKAGEGFHLFGGVELGYPASDLVIRLQAGYLFGGIFASNGDVSFDRMPLEAIMLLDANQFRFGVGVTQHINVELEDDIAGDVSFDDATGFLFQGEYKVTDKLGFGLRYTKIEYQPEDSDEELDGSGVGLYMTFGF